MNGMFNCCSSLTMIPNISKWKTNNLIEINEIFYGCSSLLIDPDISNWDLNKIKDIDSTSSFSSSVLKSHDLNSCSNVNEITKSESNLSFNSNSEEVINDYFEMNDVYKNNSNEDELKYYYDNFYN